MEIPRHWRLKKQRYGLVGEVCPHCDAKIFPPREEAPCPQCNYPQAAVVEVDRAAGQGDNLRVAAVLTLVSVSE